MPTATGFARTGTERREARWPMVLEADDGVIGITHHDHVASGRVPSPARGPEVEGVVQIDIGTSRHFAALRNLSLWA